MVLIVVLLAGWLAGMTAFYFLFILICYIVLLVWGSSQVDSQFYLPAICSGTKKAAVAGGTKNIAISFDDGPVTQFTPELLAVLQEKAVPAAFFCIGSRIKLLPDLLLQVHQEGHLIGNHSYSHAALFDLYSADRMKQELDATNDLVQSIIGVRPRLFRPPYGVTNPNLARAVRRTGMLAVGWNIRSLDTIAKDEQRLFGKLMRSLQPGGIVLLHDTSALTLRILPAFIEEARKRGYEFVRLDKLINEDPYA